MLNDPTEYHRKIEPTQLAYHNPYESTSPYSNVPDIPPPPPPKKQRIGVIVAIGSIVCLIALLGGIYLGITHANVQQKGIRATPIVTSVPTPISATPTINPNYTASDILHDFNSAGAQPRFFEYNRTVWSWTSDKYFVSVHATSSVDFADDSGCTGYCSPVDMGLWVYNSQDTAIQAYNDVLNDEYQPDASIPMMGIPNEILHGRCLLLGATAQSIYAQVVTQYCI